MPDRRPESPTRYAQGSAPAPALTRPDRPTLRITRHCSLGSAVSPVLANLFMHYAFDKWMDRKYPGCPFERYADLCRSRDKSAYADVRIMPKIAEASCVWAGERHAPQGRARHNTAVRRPSSVPGERSAMGRAPRGARKAPGTGSLN